MLASMATEPCTFKDPVLYERSLATLVRSWAYLASGSPGAEVLEAEGAAIAAFVRSPEREFLNNTVLARGASELGATLDTVEHTYATHGIERYAVWVHESEPAAAEALLARGYRFDTSTRTMAMPVAKLAEVDTTGLDLASADLGEFWRIGGVEGLVPELPAAGAHFYVARHGGENAATLMSFDHEGDCGIYMVGTVPAARRRGIATALSALAVAEARERGCTTASLQATEMAEGVYSRVGFRDLGRFEEYVP
jgi:ribosomal protein S18 acetylase RimI-like enzyme